MLDDMLDEMARLRERPVWTPVPDAVRASFREALPTQPSAADAVYRDFQQRILPYSAGNTHPRFMGWVQGGGTAIGALAEMLAAGMNPNCGGRDHGAIEVERQIARWAAEIVRLSRHRDRYLCHRHLDREFRRADGRADGAARRRVAA